MKLTKTEQLVLNEIQSNEGHPALLKFALRKAQAVRKLRDRGLIIWRSHSSLPRIEGWLLTDATKEITS